jgi:sigma-54 dependent transcriptional regulator, acetoin dehydrogenase operon transcriptional activator AcoR
MNDRAAVGSAETTLAATNAKGLKSPARLGLLWVYPESVLQLRAGLPPAPRFTEITLPAVVGRDTSCDVILEAAQVSRRHLSIRRNGPVLVAEDLQSRNGSHYAGERLTKGGLASGGVLRLGEAIAIVLGASEGQAFDYRELAPGLFGGPTLAECVNDLPRVARSDLPVIVQGPTGSGKERVAAAVHHFSARSGRFVGINCAALPEALAENELFGHKRGAFTGAERNEIGYVAAANGGTLFLDEVVELRPAVQARLLRVLQEREVVPLGDTRPFRVDLRVVVASQIPLAQAVREGRFREDLFARLNGFQITLPPLSERREDVPFLFAQFLAERFGGRPPGVRVRLMEALCLYGWPRNVREIEMLAKRLAVLHGHEPELDARHLAGLLDDGPTSARESPSGVRTVRALPDDDVVQEPDALTAALDANGGNIVRAAKQMGISRARAYRLLIARGIDVQRFRKRAARGQA